TLGLAAGSLIGATEIVDVYGRMRLENIPVTDALAKGLLDGTDSSPEAVNSLLNLIMFEAYVSGSELNSTGMGKDVEQLMSRLRTTQDQWEAAQLGVSLIPLKRLRTHAPYVAGLRTSGFQTIEVPSLAQTALEGVN